MPVVERPKRAVVRGGHAFPTINLVAGRSGRDWADFSWSAARKTAQQRESPELLQLFADLQQQVLRRLRAQGADAQVLQEARDQFARAPYDPVFASELLSDLSALPEFEGLRPIADSLAADPQGDPSVGQQAADQRRRAGQRLTEATLPGLLGVVQRLAPGRLRSVLTGAAVAGGAGGIGGVAEYQALQRDRADRAFQPELLAAYRAIEAGEDPAAAIRQVQQAREQTMGGALAEGAAGAYDAATTRTLPPVYSAFAPRLGGGIGAATQLMAGDPYGRDLAFDARGLSERAARAGAAGLADYTAGRHLRNVATGAAARGGRRAAARSPRRAPLWPGARPRRRWCR